MAYGIVVVVAGAGAVVVGALLRVLVEVGPVGAVVRLSLALDYHSRLAAFGFGSLYVTEATAEVFEVYHCRQR